MTRLWLVRHGPTHAKTMVGWSDLPADLSDTAQIERLANYLPNDAPVISSDLIRATATADAIQQNRPRLPHDPALREIHFGDWELQDFASIEAQDPTRIRAFWEQPGDVRAPKGETWNDIAARVSTAVDRLIAQHPTDLIIVAHFGAILTQVQRAENLSAYNTLSHRIDNLSVTQLTCGESGWQTGVINHLP